MSALAKAVLAYNDGSQFHCWGTINLVGEMWRISLSAIGSWELKWHVWCGRGPPHPQWSLVVQSWSDMHDVEEDTPTHPIGHWQLRVEVTCAMWRRTHPLVGHWQLRVEVTCVMWRRTHPISHWQLRFEVNV